VARTRGLNTGLVVGVSCHTQSICRYSDKAPFGHIGMNEMDPSCDFQIVHRLIQF